VLTFAKHRLSHALVLTVLAAVALAPVACGPLPVATGLGNDPCLLQQYQTRAFAAMKEMQATTITLDNRADPLGDTGPNDVITGTVDVPESVANLSTFLSAITAQWNLVRTGAHPPEGARFDVYLRDAVRAFDNGAKTLAWAYVAEGNGDTRAADDVARVGRAWLRQGRVALGLAAESLAAIPSFSTNC